MSRPHASRTASQWNRTDGASHRPPLRLEALEDRRQPAVFTVSNVSDSAAGSLRAAINDANNAPGADEIRFDIPFGLSGGTGLYSINVTSPLPTLLDTVVIDGATQPGWGSSTSGWREKPVVVLSPSNAFRKSGVDVSGLTLRADDSTVRGLTVQNFTVDGIIVYSDRNTIVGNLLRNNRAAGVELLEGASFNTVGGRTSQSRNVLSDNDVGVNIDDYGTSFNTVLGNLIGTNVSGTAAAGNLDGVRIRLATNNMIGDTTSGGRNIISGNSNAGVDIRGGGGDTGMANTVAGNYIGTQLDGLSALGNKGFGVLIIDSADGNTVGGTEPGAGNVIAGNKSLGLVIQASTGNVVAGNYVGLAADGRTAVGNVGGLLFVLAQDTTVGGTSPAARNVISGNKLSGLTISGGTNNVVAGNYIGPDASGSARPVGAGGLPVSNDTGVILRGGATQNTIGGTTSEARNIISGNAKDGIILFAQFNVVAGNYVGTTAAGTAPLANGAAGVRLRAGATNNSVGGPTAGAGNVISGNATDGVLIEDPATQFNRLAGNYIGTTADGTTAVANRGNGVRISGASSNTVGLPGGGNVISGNLGSGVRLESGSTGNTVESNFIGTDADAGAAVGNGLNGVHLVGAGAANCVGSPGRGNVLAGNTQSGVSLEFGTRDTFIEGNAIGVGFDGITGMGNHRFGVFIGANAARTFVAGGNVISGNGLAGVTIQGAGATANQVRDNRIGTDPSGQFARPNGTHGVELRKAAKTNLVTGNLISGNARDGVLVSDAGTAGNLVADNRIGLQATDAALANGWWGVDITFGACANTVEANLISGNTLEGVLLFSGGTAQNVVKNNRIGDLAPNGGGVRVAGGARDNLLGGPTAAAGNLISGNNFFGVLLEDSATKANTLSGNRIGTTAAGDAPLPNTGPGVLIRTGSSGNFIGAVNPNTVGNVIAFNAGHGVFVDSGNRNAIRQNAIFENALLGIELTAAKHANNDQAAPVLMAVTASGGVVTVIGSLQSTPRQPFFLAFYASRAADPSGAGEGEAYLVTHTFTANAAGLAAFAVTFPEALLGGRTFVSATAEPAFQYHTSEFSNARRVAGNLPPGAWGPVADMLNPHVSFGAASGADGRVYAVAGVPGQGGASERYDPATDTWTAIAPLPTTLNHIGFAVTAGPAGRIFVLGGKPAGGTHTRVEAYDPTTDTWGTTTAGGAPLAEMTVGRYTFAAVTAPDGRIYVFGGRDESETPQVLANVERYDPATNTWTTLADLPAARSGSGAAVGPDGRIYVGGGIDQSNQALANVDRYDPATNTWTTMAGLPTARWRPGVVTGADGAIYALGGSGPSFEYLASVDRYDPATDTWSPAAGMGTTRGGGFGAVAGAGRRIYALGGQDAAFAYLSSVEVLTVV